MKTAFLASTFIAGLAAVQGEVICELVNWQEYIPQVQAANFVTQWAQETGLIKAAAKLLNPLKLDDVPIQADTFNILGSDWIFDTQIQHAVIDGLQSVYISPVNVTGPTTMQLGGGMNDLKADLSLEINITQPSGRFLGRDWCFSLKFWKACEPRTVQLRTLVGLQKASLSAVANVEIVKCGGQDWLDKLACRFKSAFEFLKSLFSKPITDSLLKRVRSARLDSLTINFDAITELKLDIVNDGKVEEALLNQAIKIGKSLTNKSGLVQNLVEKTVSEVGLIIANEEIEHIGEGKFLGNCVRRL